MALAIWPARQGQQRSAGIFPGSGAIIRLVSAVLMEQNDEWTEARRRMGLQVLAKIGGAPIPADTAERWMPFRRSARNIRG